MEIKLHLLISPELDSNMPTSVKYIIDYGTIILVCNDNTRVSGKNAIVTGNKMDIHQWLIKHKNVWVGNGVPQMEHFEYMKVEQILT